MATYGELLEETTHTRAWTPVVLEVDGQEVAYTGCHIEHDEEGAQSRLVLEAASSSK
jgi:hypothetical protein